MRLDWDGWLDATEMNSFYEIALAVLPQQLVENVLSLLPVPVEDMDDQVPVNLNQDQASALETVMETPGHYTVTGSAGTGKSTLLRVLVRELQEAGLFEPVVLAPSGVAAINVRGWTIHRFFQSQDRS
ncbi:hypothetical protein BGZ65_009326, partial [Modicella reniformis]